MKQNYKAYKPLCAESNDFERIRSSEVWVCPGQPFQQMLGKLDTDMQKNAEPHFP